ncbi:hypothetical protein GC163_07835 [bacterium]|nr:hypothetical protein [bacterium]
MKPRLLQIANVGQICGGTAACAWTVTQALPGFDHHVAFLSSIHADTRRVFVDATLHAWTTVTLNLVRSVCPDVVLLHNISPQKLNQRLPIPTVQYVHSAGRKAEADVTVYCSHWLAQQFEADSDDVLWQGVPLVNVARTSATDRPLIIGRICTPQLCKWPMELIAFYETLSPVAPEVWWEFVGCPSELQAGLKQACGGRARFFPAGWEQRQFLGCWDALLYHHPTLPESFGRVVAEAMRAGCIPIVDHMGGFREQLREGGGFLCRDLSDFQQAMIQLRDPSLRKTLSQQTLQIGESRWSLDRFAKALLTRLDAAVAHFSRAAS